MPTQELTTVTTKNHMPTLFSVQSSFAKHYDYHEQSQAITLSDAMGGDERNYPSQHYIPSEDYPTTPAQAMKTGLLPPADEADMARIRLQNKATDVQKVSKLLELDTATLADTKGYRIRTAYRLVRQMSRIRGLLIGWDKLQTSLDTDHYGEGISAWYSPIKTAPTSNSTGFRGIIGLLQEASNLPDRYTFQTTSGYRAFKGITSLPPLIPDQHYGTNHAEDLWTYRASRHVPKEYDPGKDMPLLLFCETMTMLAHQMSIQQGAPEEKHSGIYGMAGLFNPYTARLAWPTRDELILYEEELLLHTFEKISTVSELGTQRYLRQFFGFQRFEAVDITKSAMEAGGMLYVEGAEEQRASVLKRIDEVMDKCSDACDPRAELAAIKLKAQLNGLTVTDESETMQAFRDATVNMLQKPSEEDDR